MNLYLTRDGQTFGPYTVEQAREYLIGGQFLEQDFALFEGQTEWQSLGQLLASAELPQPVEEAPLAETLSATGQSRTPVASSGEGAQSSATGQEAAVTSSSAPKQTSGGRKTRKITRMNKGGTVVVPKQRSALSKIVSTCIVFLVTLVVVGGLVAILFFVWPGPATMGPILAKMGIPVQEQSPAENTEPNSGAVARDNPTKPGEVMLEEEHFQRLRISGIRILPIEGDKGLQVISSVDSEMAMQDDDLSALDPLADYVVSLDLTNSKVTDEGLGLLLRMKNLEKLNLEGTKSVTVDGIAKLKALERLSYLNLVRVQMDDTLVDTLIGMENLREVYLYQSGLTEDAMARLGVARPKMFVKGG